MLIYWFQVFTSCSVDKTIKIWDTRLRQPALVHSCNIVIIFFVTAYFNRELKPIRKMSMLFHGIEMFHICSFPARTTGLLKFGTFVISKRRFTALLNSIILVGINLQLTSSGIKIQSLLWSGIHLTNLLLPYPVLSRYI